MKDTQKKCFEILVLVLLTSSLGQLEPKRNLAINQSAGCRLQTPSVGARGGSSIHPDLQSHFQSPPKHPATARRAAAVVLFLTVRKDDQKGKGLSQLCWRVAAFIVTLGKVFQCPTAATAYLFCKWRSQHTAWQAAQHPGQPGSRVRRGLGSRWGDRRHAPAWLQPGGLPRPRQPSAVGSAAVGSAAHRVLAGRGQRSAAPPGRNHCPPASRSAP